MDDTMCEYASAHARALAAVPQQRFPQAEMDFFRGLAPIPGALDSMRRIAAHGYDVWILSRPSYQNPLCYTEKRLWVEDHLGLEWCEKLILCPDKSLLRGEWLIDDVLWGFEGRQLRFSRESGMDWPRIVEILCGEK